MTRVWLVLVSILAIGCALYWLNPAAFWLALVTLVAWPRGRGRPRRYSRGWWLL